MGYPSLDVIKKVAEILTLSQSILKAYQDFELATENEAVEQLPTTKKAFQNSQKIMKAYQAEPEALPLGVFAELEKISAELLQNPLLEEKVIRLAAILQKYPTAKALLETDVKTILQNFSSKKQTATSSQASTTGNISPEPYLKRILECKKDLFDKLKGNKQLADMQLLTSQINATFASNHPLASALKTPILNTLALLFSDGDESNDTMHTVANLIIKNGLELFDTAAELQAHFAVNADFYAKNPPNALDAVQTLPLLSASILKSASGVTNTPNLGTSTKPSPAEQARMQQLFQQVQTYLKENPRYRA